jgi:DNA-binding beta-propeller fold protein YncE
MKKLRCFLLAAALIASIAPSTLVLAQTPPAMRPYKVVNLDRVGGPGGFDYVLADSDARRLYIPRGNRVTVFDLDTLKPLGEIPNTNSVHGVAVDSGAHHGFSSSQPVVMWDTRTLATIRIIPVQGRPDGILFDPGTQRVFILSHEAPNATVIDAQDGSVVGTIGDLGGAPEQGASDSRGHLFFDLEDKDQVAAVDANTLRVTAHYGLGGKGGAPAGLALDVKNHTLFVCGRKPQTAVMLNADDGSIIASLPIGSGVDSAEFNPATMEAFSSQRDGTLTVIRENSPTQFAVEQTVQTKLGAKTSTLDVRTNQIFLITADRAPAPPPPSSTPSPGAAPAGTAHGRGSPMVPGSFTIIVVRRSTE